MSGYRDWPVFYQVMRCDDRAEYGRPCKTEAAALRVLDRLIAERGEGVAMFYEVARLTWRPYAPNAKGGRA